MESDSEGHQPSPNQQTPADRPQAPRPSLLAPLQSLDHLRYAQEYAAADMSEMSPGTFKDSPNSYFNGLAKRTLILERFEGEYANLKKKEKMDSMFKVFDEFLRTTCKLGADQALNKQIAEISLRVNEIFKKNNAKYGHLLRSKEHPQRQQGLSVKYLFVALLHLALKSKTVESKGAFLFEISLNEIIKCYSYLHICPGTLSKYLNLCKTLIKEYDFSITVENIQDRSALLGQYFEKVLKHFLKNYQIFGFELKPDSEEKLQKSFRRLIALEDDIEYRLSHRPVIYHSFAIFVLCLNAQGFSKGLKDLIDYFKEEDQLLNLNYSTVSGCLRVRKQSLLLKLLRILQVFQTKSHLIISVLGRQAFILYEWKKYLAPSSSIGSGKSGKKLRSADDSLSDWSMSWNQCGGSVVQDEVHSRLSETSNACGLGKRELALMSTYTSASEGELSQSRLTVGEGLGAPGESSLQALEVIPMQSVLRFLMMKEVATLLKMPELQITLN